MNQTDKKNISKIKKNLVINLLIFFISCLLLNFVIIIIYIFIIISKMNKNYIYKYFIIINLMNFFQKQLKILIKKNKFILLL